MNIDSFEAKFKSSDGELAILKMQDECFAIKDDFKSIGARFNLTSVGVTFTCQGTKGDPAYEKLKFALRGRVLGLRIIKFEDKLTPKGVDINVLRPKLLASTKARVVNYIKAQNQNFYMAMLKKDEDEYVKVQMVYNEYIEGLTAGREE